MKYFYKAGFIVMVYVEIRTGAFGVLSNFPTLPYFCFSPKRSCAVAQSKCKRWHHTSNSWRDRHRDVFNNGNGHSGVRLVTLSSAFSEYTSRRKHADVQLLFAALHYWCLGSIISLSEELCCTLIRKWQKTKFEYLYFFPLLTCFVFQINVVWFVIHEPVGEEYRNPLWIP